MPILYGVVARDATVLARYAVCAGNFAEVTEQILGKIATSDVPRLTYSHASYLFHYMVEEGLVFLCITDDDFERRRAFLFLEDVKSNFQSMFRGRIHSALPYGMNSEFVQVLSEKMKHFSESTEVDVISKLQGEVGDVKDILIKNIECLSAREEKLELLINKTDNLNATALTFKSSSRTLRRQMWWKNTRIIIYIVIGLAVSVYIIGAMACGVTWKSCTG